MLRFTLKCKDDESVAQIRNNVAIYLPQCFGNYFGNDLNNSSHNHEEANSTGCSCWTGCYEEENLFVTLYCVRLTSYVNSDGYVRSCTWLELVSISKVTLSRRGRPCHKGSPINRGKRRPLHLNTCGRVQIILL